MGINLGSKSDVDFTVEEKNKELLLKTMTLLGLNP
jgi:hypothetical protein